MNEWLGILYGVVGILLALQTIGITVYANVQRYRKMGVTDELTRNTISNRTEMWLVLYLMSGLFEIALLVILTVVN